MVVGVKVGGRDLYADANRSPKPMPDRKLAEDDTGRQKHLLPPGVWPIVVKRRIHLELWPDLTQNAILAGQIPNHRLAEFLAVGRR